MNASERNEGTQDLGGIDPVGNRGVFDFKRGFTRHAAATGPVSEGDVILER